VVKVITSTLEHGTNNWSQWHVNFLKDYLLSKHAWAYILSTIIHPVEADDPASATMWDTNNKAIIAIMRGYCTLEEKLFLKGQTNTFHAWRVLHEQHEQIGSIT
jgi:hypothetical protein